MKVEVYHGDILDFIGTGYSYSIAHNCNCFHTMGAGIAKVLNGVTGGKLLKEDKTTVYGDINKLGGYSRIMHEGNEYFNLYGMFSYSSMLKTPNNGNVYVHWNSLKHALTNAIVDSVCDDVVIPILGYSHAGGSVEDFMDMVDGIIESLNDVPKTLHIVYND